MSPIYVQRHVCKTTDDADRYIGYVFGANVYGRIWPSSLKLLTSGGRWTHWNSGVARDMTWSFVGNHVVWEVTVKDPQESMLESIHPWRTSWYTIYCVCRCRMETDFSDSVCHWNYPYYSCELLHQNQKEDRYYIAINNVLGLLKLSCFLSSNLMRFEYN